MERNWDTVSQETSVVLKHLKDTAGPRMDHMKVPYRAAVHHGTPRLPRDEDPVCRPPDSRAEEALGSGLPPLVSLYTPDT